jgi:outer membrane protein assembly factor BamB
MRRLWITLLFGAAACAPNPQTPSAVNCAPPADPGPPDLTPATPPPKKWIEPESVPVPDGTGDRVILDRDRVTRVGLDGRSVWTRVFPTAGGVRPPHLTADASRVFVGTGDGVVALHAGTGAVVWHRDGPASRILLSRDLVLAAQTGYGTRIKEGGRWLVAWVGATGAEAFRVALPPDNFDALPVEEWAGLFVVQRGARIDGFGDTLLIDRAGAVHSRLDCEVVNMVRRAGGGRAILTGRGVLGLSAAGATEWEAKFGHAESYAGGGLVPLPEGDLNLVAFVYNPLADSGVRVMRLDPATGKKRWEMECAGVGGGHSAYSHWAGLEVRGGRLVVTSVGWNGTFVEALDADRGQSVGRRVIQE